MQVGRSTVQAANENGHCIVLFPALFYLRTTTSDRSALIESLRALNIMQPTYSVLDPAFLNRRELGEIVHGPRKYDYYLRFIFREYVEGAGADGTRMAMLNVAGPGLTERKD